MADKLEFKWLSVKLVGTDTVVFRLEDGAMVKVKVDIDRAGVAINFTNPDGTPHYTFDLSQKVTVVPSSKKFLGPKPPVAPRKEPQTKPI